MKCTPDIQITPSTPITADKDMNRKDSYVYAHYHNKELMYIGLGTGDRARVKKGRSDKWKAVFKDIKPDIFIIKSNMRWDQAHELEKQLIRSLNPKLNVTKY